jgi:hypothetical protein
VKTLHLSIIAGVSIILIIIGNATESFAINFESVRQKYLTLVNATELNSIIINSSEFKEKTHGYHYFLATVIPRLKYQENYSYTLGSVDVVYAVYLSDKLSYDKTLVTTMDSNSKILGMMEYTPRNVPLGYPLPIASTLYLPDNYTTNIDINKLVYVIPPSPLDQVKHGVAANDVDCLQSVRLGLIFKAEDKSPACVKDNTARVLIERGWAINQTNESITISAEQPYHVDFVGNRTVTAVLMLDVELRNFQHLSPPLSISIFYTNGTIFHTDEVSMNAIPSDGHYNHIITITSNNPQDIIGKHKVVVIHNGNSNEMLVDIQKPPQ